jgi:hypothetical protein
MHFENASQITFRGSTAQCPVCNAPAPIMSGTYDFSGAVVKVVQAADLTLGDLETLIAAVRQARKGQQTPEEFIAEHPRAEPLVRLVVEHRHSRDWLALLVAVLAIVATFVEPFATDAVKGDPPRRTTQSITDADAEKLGKAIRQAIDSATTTKPPPPPPKKAPRNKRRR